MKTLWFYKPGFVWLELILIAIFFPGIGHAKDCEANVQAAFAKHNLDTELKVISGELSELEAAGTREKLERELKRGKENCSRIAASRAESETASF